MVSIGPIVGIISFAGALVLFTSPFVEGNFILTAALSALILIEGIYYFLLSKKNVLKGSIKIISSIALLASLFWRLPFGIAVIVGIALIITGIYDLFSVIIEKD